MKEYFIASAVIHGVQGGSVILTDDAFWFCCDKITIDDEYKRLRIPYEDIRSVSFKKAALFFPVAKLELKNGRVHKFVIFSQKRFLKCINMMCGCGEKGVVEKENRTTGADE